MPRSPRVNYANACYHVMNRGIAKNPIFYNEKSYQIFLEILGESCKKFEVIIHAYCLMSNHYHLLLETPKANLSKFMQYLGACYTQRYNKFMETDGPIFRGRFKSKIVEDDSYFVGLGKYIHCNPKEFVSDLQSYKWSSYQCYLGLRENQFWLEKDKMLKILGASGSEFSYKDFVEGV